MKTEVTITLSLDEAIERAELIVHGEKFREFKKAVKIHYPDISPNMPVHLVASSKPIIAMNPGELASLVEKYVL